MGDRMNKELITFEMGTQRNRSVDSKIECPYLRIMMAPDMSWLRTEGLTTLNGGWQRCVASSQELEQIAIKNHGGTKIVVGRLRTCDHAIAPRRIDEHNHST